VLRALGRERTKAREREREKWVFFCSFCGKRELCVWGGNSVCDVCGNAQNAGCFLFGVFLFSANYDFENFDILHSL
jgi:hypothetical protein